MYNEPKQRIDASALKAWMLSGWISTVFYAAIVAGVIYLGLRFDWPVWVAVVVTLLAVAQSVLEILIWPRLKYRQWRYEILDEEIQLQYGILFRHRTLIPMVRVQHVDTKQGPILRKFGLATVTFSTAAGSHEIPALSEGSAEQVRRQIANLARLSDEEI
ncbi:PH domain-containing protein [Paenibacillus daejeonensis]|uniref:PH domain-containing protein n=1 Tax=Paenibacillus daejeonensis TaxID=135193 RepID=UPI00035E12C7|nr:PH domain-containing protein [Paenibacillus daejeonensis]